MKKQKKEYPEIDPVTGLSPRNHEADRVYGRVGQCGFHRTDDPFTFHLSDSDRGPIERIVNEETGLNTLVEQINNFAATNYSRLAGQKRDWWDRILADFGVTRDTHRCKLSNDLSCITFSKNPPKVEPKTLTEDAEKADEAKR